MPCPFDIPCEFEPKQSFEGMTNGEVIRTVFNDKDYLVIADRLQHTMWWNAPYKASPTGAESEGGTRHD